MRPPILSNFAPLKYGKKLLDDFIFWDLKTFQNTCIAGKFGDGIPWNILATARPVHTWSVCVKTNWTIRYNIFNGYLAEITWLLPVLHLPWCYFQLAHQKETLRLLMKNLFLQKDENSPTKKYLLHFLWVKSYSLKYLEIFSYEFF